MPKKRSKFIRIAIYGPAVCAALIAISLYYLLEIHVPSPTEISIHGDAENLGRMQGEATAFSSRMICRYYLRKGLCHDDEKIYSKRGKRALAALPSGSLYSIEL